MYKGIKEMTFGNIKLHCIVLFLLLDFNILIFIYNIKMMQA